MGTRVVDPLLDLDLDCLPLALGPLNELLLQEGLLLQLARLLQPTTYNMNLNDFLFPHL